MGNFFGNMKDMGKLLKQAGDMQKRIGEIKNSIEEKTYKAAAGGGAVIAQVSGQMKVLKIEISNTLLAPSDKETLEDLIVVAINNALDEAQVDLKNSMNEITGGISIPGIT